MKRKPPLLDKHYSKHREVSPEETEIWLSHLRDEKSRKKPAAQKPRPLPTVVNKEQEKPAKPKKPSIRLPHLMDKETLRTLRKGDATIEATLDLHEHTQEKAHKALSHFILKCYSNNKRLVLVITGKGRNGAEGILCRMLPLWLAETPLREHIIAYDNASARHGGTGAWYIRIRKQQ